MGDTQRYKVNAVDRKNRMAKSGKLPKDGGSRRSDRIRAIADDLADEFGDEFDDDLLEIEANLS